MREHAKSQLSSSFFSLRNISVDLSIIHNRSASPRCRLIEFAFKALWLPRISPLHFKAANDTHIKVIDTLDNFKPSLEDVAL
jgi:hypothetical protein